MARLSAENFKNTATPTTRADSKSTRFKDLFRGGNSRSSLSPLSAISPPPASPPISPTGEVKPGFQKIGLLPSERAITGIARNRRGAFSISPPVSPRESLAGQEQELKGVSVSHNLDTNLEASGGTRHTMVQEPAKPKILSEGQNTHAGEEDGPKMPTSGTSEPATETIKELDDTTNHALDSDGQPTSMSHMLSDDVRETVTEQQDQEAREGETAHSQAHDAARVASAEELGIQPHDAGVGSSGLNSDRGIEATISTMTNNKEEVVAKIEPGSDSSTSASNPTAVPIPATQQENTVSSIGPFRVKNIHTANLLYRSMMALYVYTGFIAAAFGPKTLFLTAWRFALVCATYELARQHLGWTEAGATDIVVEPVKRAGKRAWALVLVGMHKAVEDTARIILEAVKATNEATVNDH
ncbi:hypothetical protein P280DRAFT_528828 [Massarina eburnea CBS 473.64]|uniref:Uncharacterized protein n=1 Tax=Massarina eburnea CBS 473.64 TaxID=1395130 RepID=A0A6A6RSQ3_9PLEO|nr:hypothetical protein P280DRAFT_528828 [Massarina eburnea CBS 473.64]